MRKGMQSVTKIKSHIPYAVYLAVTFLIIGMIFSAVGGGFAISNQRFLSVSEEASATISEIREYGSGDDTEYDVFVTFTTRDGRLVKTELREYASTMEVGSVITVYYDPADPTDARYLVTAQILSWVFLVLGGLFLLGAAVPLVLFWRSKQIHKRLREEGRRVYARIDRYQVNTSIRIFNKSPVVLILSAQVGMQTLEFRCRNMFRDPQMLIGRYAAVYFNPEKPAQYAVEVSVDS